MSSLPLPDNPSPGWKKDPEDKNKLRFWDGENWQDQVEDPELTDSPVPARLGLIVLIVAALVAVSGILGFVAVPMLIISLVIFFLALASWVFDKIRGST